MVEAGSGGSPEFEGINPGPNGVLRDYFSRRPLPTAEEVERAAKLVEEHQHIEGVQDSFSICVDMAITVPEATTVLAGMINTNHAALPKRWRHDHRESTMVLSMVGEMEMGYLRAMQEAVVHGPLLATPERIDEIQGLLGALRGEAPAEG